MQTLENKGFLTRVVELGLASVIGIAPTCIRVQEREHLRMNPHIPSSSVSYQCYFDYVQDIDTPIYQGLQLFLPHLQDTKKLCEETPGLSFGVVLEIKTHEDDFSPAFFLEPETIEMLHTYGVGLSINLLDKDE